MADSEITGMFKGGIQNRVDAGSKKVRAEWHSDSFDCGRDAKNKLISSEGGLCRIEPSLIQL